MLCKHNSSEFFRICNDYHMIIFHPLNTVALLVLTARLFIRSCIVSATAVTVLSLAELCKLKPNVRNISFMKIFHYIEPKIDPCGTPDSIWLK